MQSIGERLSYIRKQILRLNQHDFSNKLGVSQGALSDIGRNNRGLPIEALVNLMKYSKSDKSFSLEWLLLGDEPKNVPIVLSENEQRVIELMQPLTTEDQIKIVGIIENYLGIKIMPSLTSAAQAVREEQMKRSFKNITDSTK